jgi:hypothetical protein
MEMDHMKHTDVFTTDDHYLPGPELEGEVKCVGRRTKVVNVPSTDPVVMFDKDEKLVLAYGRIEFVESLLRLLDGRIQVVQYTRRPFT